MTHYPKITIITPNLNGEQYLERTIESVLGQGYPNLEYIVMDGGSTDGSTDIIRKYEKHLAHWGNSPDRGMYEALDKGFRKSTGEIMGWINSDDLLMKRSLFTLAELFAVDETIRWIQGYPVVTNDDDQIVYHRPAVGSKLFFYLKDYRNGRFIQQESTFWKRSLWEDTGKFISTEYRFASDFELWIRFFNHALLYVTDAILGSFRIRKNGQTSTSNYQNYLAECDHIIDCALPLLPKAEQNLVMNVKKWRSSGHQDDDPALFFIPGEPLPGIAAKLPLVSFDFNRYCFTLNPLT